MVALARSSKAVRTLESRARGWNMVVTRWRWFEVVDWLAREAIGLKSILTRAWAVRTFSPWEGGFLGKVG